MKSDTAIGTLLESAFRLLRHRAGRWGAVLGAGLPLGGCSGGIFDSQGPVGAADAKILLDALGIMLVIVVPTIVGTVLFAWWFRVSNTRARYRPDFVYSGRIEIIVWAIPILVILFLGGVIWIGSHTLDPFAPIPSPNKPLRVQVVSLDWKWLFIYPDQGIASVNELVVPAGTPIHFFLTSASVMNAFFVPQLGSMVATMNGMITQLHLLANKPGKFYGESAQFSGDGFAGMHFTIHAVSPAEFTQWVAATRRSNAVLDNVGYNALQQESENVQPFTYRAVDPKLFDAIVRRNISPSIGPRGRPAGSGVHPVGGR